MVILTIDYEHHEKGCGMTSTSVCVQRIRPGDGRASGHGLKEGRGGDGRGAARGTFK